MTESTHIASHYAVDDLDIDAGSREVRRGVDVLEFPGLSFDLLLALVRAAPNVLSHDDLEELVWAGRPVSPETVTQRVKLVRDALGDTADSPRYIAGVRGRGYRLIASVKEVDGKAGRRLRRPAIILSVLFLMIAAALYVTFKDRSEPPETVQVTVPQLPSIAVLFFDDLSENRDQAHFSNGMSEALIRELAQVTGLRVIAKTSSFYYKDKEIRISDIASELQVGHVLEGSIQTAGNRVRVTAQLIDVSNDSSVWSQNFDRDLVDIFAVQDEIALEVVEALKVSLLDREEIRLAQRYRPSLEAYEQLILGQLEYEAFTFESMALAEAHFLRAIELDPGYATAYVRLANTYTFQVDSSGLPMEESIARRQPLIEKALELDPFSGEAYAARATLHFDKGNVGLAESDYLKAIELNPSDPVPYQWYSALLRHQGRFEEALAQMEVSAELDPLAPFVHSTLGMALWGARRVEEALAMTRKGMDRYPHMNLFYIQMAIYQATLGNLGEAQWWNDKSLELDPRGAQTLRWRCTYFLNLGDLPSAENCATQFSELYPGSRRTFYVQYWLQVYRGEYDAAIATQEAILARTQTPERATPTALLADLIAAQGDLERARRLLSDTVPKLLDNDVNLAVSDLDAALTFAAILHANGETRQRDVLLLAMESRIATMARTHGYAYGILDVYIHAMRGDRDRAIAALREAIDSGWKVSNFTPAFHWWRLRSDWRLEGLTRDSEFIALVEKLEADVAAELTWYEENKGKPLK